jgi:uncharacterized membrane protein YtjA (UPF0391 family)
MRSAAESRAVARLYLQHLVLGSLVRSLEAEAELKAGRGRLNRLRARRAEQEAARLRDVLQSLGASPQLRARGQQQPDSPRQPVRVADRIAAYTHGTSNAGVGAGELLVTAAAADRLHPPPHSLSRARRLGLVVLWFLCAAALLAALGWRGVESAVSGTADVALMLVTLVLFATSLFGAGAEDSRGEERRCGSDRRKAPNCRAPFGLERRSGRDRRFDEAQPVASGAPA